MKTFSRAWLVAAALAATVCQPAAAAIPQHIEQAILLIRGACTLPGASLDIKPSGDGRLNLQFAMSNGTRRLVQLANRDADVFTDTTMGLQGRQPFDLQACMEPYINDVISTLITLPERIAPGAAAGPAPSGGGGAYQPPVMAAPSAPPAPVAAPARPPLPAGDLPVSVVLGTAPAAAGAAVAVAVTPMQRASELAFRVSGCRATGRDVVCDVKVTNDTGQDHRVVLQGSYTKLYGADGSEIRTSWVLMGNQREDVRHGKHEANMKIIADTSPVLNVVFREVPDVLTTIKRLEVSVGPQTTNGIALQKLTLADVQIQGR